jgi:hypothetical protein
LEIFVFEQITAVFKHRCNEVFDVNPSLSHRMTQKVQIALILEDMLSNIGWIFIFNPTSQNAILF